MSIAAAVVSFGAGLIFGILWCNRVHTGNFGGMADPILLPGTKIELHDGQVATVARVGTSDSRPVQVDYELDGKLYSVHARQFMSSARKANVDTLRLMDSGMSGALSLPNKEG